MRWIKANSKPVQPIRRRLRWNFFEGGGRGLLNSNNAIIERFLERRHCRTGITVEKTQSLCSLHPNVAIRVMQAICQSRNQKGSILIQQPRKGIEVRIMINGPAWPGLYYLLFRFSIHQ